jgi:hypothetical protein
MSETEDGSTVVDPVADIRGQLQTLLAEHRALQEHVRSSRSRVWDWAALLVTPLSAVMIGVATLYATSTYERQEQKTRALEVFGTFVPYLTSSNPAQQSTAILALHELGEEELARVAARTYSGPGSLEGLQMILNGDLPALERRKYQKELSELMVPVTLEELQGGAGRRPVPPGIPPGSVPVVIPGAGAPSGGSVPVTRAPEARPR